jgi:hypothetical protein
MILMTMIINVDELSNLLESFGEHSNKSILSYGNSHLLFNFIDDCNM